LPTLRDNLSVPSSGIKKKKKSWPLKMGPIICPETSVRNYHYSLRNNPGERSSLPSNLPTRILQHFLLFLV
jgi:hypothetical protein